MSRPGDLPFPPIRAVQLLPERRGPLPAVGLFDDWLQSNSRFLIISGAPGVGKTRALEALKERAGDRVKCVDDFPSPGQSFDVSRLLEEARGTEGPKLAVATQTRIDDRRSGALPMLGSPTIWAIILHPLAIPEVTELITALAPAHNVARLRALIALEERGHDTHFLRSREALAILVDLPPSEKSIPTITELVREFVVELSFKARGMSPARQRELLSMICYAHFLGSGSSHPDADLHSDRVPDVAEEWLAHLLNNDSDSAGQLADFRAFVDTSPFLTARLGGRGGEPARVILPDALVYEYFVASGMLLALRRGEDVRVSVASLGQLSDGMVVLFLHSEIESEDFDAIERQCRRSGVTDPERLLFLFLLEDEESFMPLLREAGPAYVIWLDRFKERAPNTFCWKMAAYQLLALGELPLREYLEVVELELPDERAYEFTAQASRGAGDVDRQLIARLRRDDLRNCRGVTALRMGISGSLDCVVPLADAMADEPDEYVRGVIRSQIQKIVVRNKQ